MNILADLAQYADLAGGVIGLLLTLMVFSYIFGDNGLFRLAIHIFIGVAAAFAAVMVVYNVIIQRMILTITQDPLTAVIQLAVPLLGGFWLLSKLSPRLARLGNPVMAYLVGVGAATAIGGAVVGTIFPQAGATASLFDLGAMPSGEKPTIWLIKGSVILVGALSTLVYFHYGARPQADQRIQRPLWLEWWNRIFGRFFIAVTFGALFAGVYAASLTALVERMNFILTFFINYIFPLIFPGQ